MMRRGSTGRCREILLGAAIRAPSHSVSATALRAIVHVDNDAEPGAAQNPS